MAAIHIQVEVETLEDGSEVFSVALNDPLGFGIDLPALNEHHAYQLAKKLAEAIEAHTTFETEIQ
jgi:hypothetical protein